MDALRRAFSGKNDAAEESPEEILDGSVNGNGQGEQA